MVLEVIHKGFNLWGFTPYSNIIHINNKYYLKFMVDKNTWIEGEGHKAKFSKSRGEFLEPLVESLLQTIESLV